MVRLLHNDKSKIMEQIKKRDIDNIVACDNCLIDDVILSMYQRGIIKCLDDGLSDHRKQDHTIPFSLMITLAVSAKMKGMRATSDIPYAIRDHKLLTEMDYNLYMGENAFSEKIILHLLKKYALGDQIAYYNNVIDVICKKEDIHTHIHILNCVKIAENTENTYCENVSLTLGRKENKMSGYKLASLRGLYQDSGIIEEVKIETASVHDSALSRSIIETSSHLHDGDSLLIDQGFISRELINHLKKERNIDVYIPVQRNTAIYDLAIAIAEESDDWKPHPRRKDEMICLVEDVGIYWNDDPEKDVDLNACVAWTVKDQKYSVFVTTDLHKSAEEIVVMHHMRWEIEEDYRQLKDYWILDDFHHTKQSVITFHLICMLFGYLFYQLYLNADKAKKYIEKSLPMIQKQYKGEFSGYFALYSKDHYCIVSMRELLNLFADANDGTKRSILRYFK